MDAVCNFLDQFGCYLLSCNVFCGEGVDGGEGENFLSVGRKCCGGVMWSFSKEATSFFNRFISSSNFSFVVFWFSSSEFDVDKAVDLGLL